MFDLGQGRIGDDWGAIGGRAEAEAKDLGFSGPRDDALLRPFCREPNTTTWSSCNELFFPTLVPSFPACAIFLSRDQKKAAHLVYGQCIAGQPARPRLLRHGAGILSGQPNVEFDGKAPRPLTRSFSHSTVNSFLIQFSRMLLIFLLRSPLACNAPSGRGSAKDPSGR